MSLDEGTKTWAQMLAEFEVAHSQPRPPDPPPLPMAMRCADSNPWDAAILCHLPDGHSPNVLHEGEMDHGHLTRWADRCHFPGDSCDPGTHHEEDR